MRKMDNRAAQGSQLLTMMLVMFVMMFIFADPNISALIAVTLDSVFYPLIGFGGSCPVLTIILAGILVVSLSSFFNNLFANWKKMGEMQELSRAFQKEVTAARKQTYEDATRDYEKTNRSAEWYDETYDLFVYFHCTYFHVASVFPR